MATTITGTTIDVNTAVLNRLSTDGTIVDLQKDGTSVGSIGSRAGVVSTIILNPASGNGAGLSGGTKTIVPADEAGIIDNDISLGISSHRFKDLYLSGGVYLGGTAAANKLDDYEEGTWTPTIGGTTTNPSVGYAVQAGVYTKIGNLVHIAVRLNFNSYSGGSGRVHITGLPFTVGSITVSPYAGLTLGLIANINFGASNTQLTTIFDAASTNINFLGLQTSAGYTDLTVSALSVSSTLSLSGSYYV